MDLGGWTQQARKQGTWSSESENKEGAESSGDIWGQSIKNCLWNTDVSLGPMYHQAGSADTKEIQQLHYAAISDLYLSTFLQE